uniref:Uncharacterized protein n=1 Tax=Parastrongyloides trichosuri TaxID=131310 RepID=A0A0N5A6P5_PARTI
MSELNQEKSHDEKVDEIIESESEEIERIRIEKRKKEIYLIIQEYIEFIKDILKKEKTQEVRDKLNEDLEGFEKSRESTIKELISFSDDEINKIKKIVEESKVLLIKEIEEIKDKKIKGILQKIVDYMNFDLTIYPKDSHIHNVLRRMYMDKTFEKIKGYIINDDIEKAFKIFNKYISKRIEEYKIENNIFDTLNRRIEIYLRDPKFKQTNENFFNPEISGKNPVTGEYQIKPFRLPQWNGVDFRSTKIVIPQWNGVDFRTKTINLPQWNGVDFISKTENIPQWNGVDSMKKTGNIPQWNGVDFIKKIINIPQWNGVDFMKKTGNIPQWNGEFFVSQESNLPQWNGVDSKSDVKSKSLLNRQIRTKALNLSQ